MVLTQDQLKKLIFDTGLADEKSFADVVLYAQNAEISIEDALVEKNIITDEKLGVLIGDFLKIPFITLSKVSIANNVFNIVPERVARKQKVIAFDRTPEGIKLAMANPTNKLVLTKISKVPTPHSVSQWVELGKIENLHWAHQTAGQCFGKRLFGGPDQRADRKLLGAR